MYNVWLEASHLAVYARVNTGYWTSTIFNISTIRQGALSAHLQMTQNLEERLLYKVVTLPFRETSTSWRNGPTRMSSSSEGNPSPTASKETPQAPARAGELTVRKQLCRTGSGGPGGHQAECEPAMHPCSREGQQPSGLHQEEHYQHVKGGDSFPLLHAVEITSGVWVQC